MPITLSIKRLGLNLSVALAMLYIIIMLASLLLVGLLTTGSWQAAFLEIGWYTIVGFELGFVGVLIVGFAVAVVFMFVENLVHNLINDWSKTTMRSGQSDAVSTRSWQVRLLAVCLVFPALSLLVLRMLASVGAFGVAASTAEESMQDPSAQMQPVAMSPIINTAYREAEPSFTADGRTMYFNCNSSNICVSHLTGTWEDGNWSPPERLAAPISSEYEEVEPVINADGDKLYFTSIRPTGLLKGIPFLSPFMNVLRVANNLTTTRLGRSFFGGMGLPDVYVSYRVDGAWSEPQSINDTDGEPPINTSFADHCLFFSDDGNEAFWTSTRPGGFGDNDIWTARRVDGKWTDPENLGSNVNSPGSEHTSIPTPDGRSLYVTAVRDKGFGGDDIYITMRDSEGEWEALVNLGSLVNGKGDDRCPAWTPDLRIFLFDSVRSGGFGARDIWWVDYKDVLGYTLTAKTGVTLP